MASTRIFRDTESGDLISLDALRAEFLALVAAGEVEHTAEEFPAYVRECCGKNGFLIEI